MKRSSSYLTAAVGIPHAECQFLDNNAAYLAHWIDAMKEDHRIIFQISSAASKAADFILGFSEDQGAESHEEEMVAV